MKKLVQKTSFQLALGLALVLFVFYFFSSYQFSSIFTIANTIQMYGFVLVVLSITVKKTVSGLSLTTFKCYLVSFSVRALLFLKYKGYLPLDKSGQLFFKLQQWLMVGVILFLCHKMMNKFKNSYNKDYDTINIYVLIGLCLVLAVFAHPSHNINTLADVAWAFSQYLQVVAIIPQFLLFMKKGGQIQASISNYIASQVISRILNLIFWYQVHGQLNTLQERSISPIKNYVGYFFMAMQLLHLLVMSDFIYQYVKSIRDGKNIIFPSYV